MGAERQTVRFPVVREGRGHLAELTLKRQPEFDGKEKFARCPELRSILSDLTDVRFNEPSSAQSIGVVGVVSDRNVNGDSYGLALALADRMLRHGAATDDAVIATGRIVPNGGGKIGAIDDFLIKLRMVIRTAPDSLFVYPSVQLELSGPEGKALLEEASAAGLRLLPVTDIVEAALLWQRPSTWRKWTMLAAVVLLVAVGGFVALRHFGAAQRCEREIDRLDASSPPAAAAPALAACRAAVRAEPDDGRLHFLLAQAFIVNGSRALGEREWARAAALEDPDGAAAYGRHLWLAGSGTTIQNGNRALPWLRQAANAGSAAAMEDIAGLLRDPGRKASELAEAAQWDRRAHRVRQEQGARE